MPLNKVTITGTFDDGSGTALSGTAVFTPSQTVYFNGVPVVNASNPVSVAITGGALQAVQLVATDNTGPEFLSQTGFWFWTVAITLNGVNQPGFSFFLPHTPTTVDLYTLANTGSGGASLSLDTNASDFQPLGVAAAGNSGFAADGKHVHPYEPYQFLPEAYGAKGDGKIIGDATVTSGLLSTLTSATANFTSADTGKTIMLNGGQGNNAQPLITTITFVNSTTVTLAAPASGALANASAIYGTDDVTAFNNMMTAIGTYATGASGNYHAQVILGNKFYCLVTPPPVASGIAGSTTCQVRLPSPNANGTTQKIVLDILGVGSADANMYFDSAIPNIQGSALVSMCIPAYSPGTNPYPSVLGYQYADTGGLTGGFANTKVFVSGLTVVIPFLGPQGAYDFRFLGGAGIGSASAMSFSAVAGSYNNLPSLNGLGGQQGGSSVGLFMPLTGNNDDCQIDSFAVEGFTYGINVTEHIAAKRLDAIYCIVGIQCVGGGAHGNWIGYYSAEVCTTAVQFTGVSAFPLVIDYLDSEQISTWHIQDTQNALYGSVLVHTNSGSPPAVLGASHMRVIYDLRGPALAPSVTALTFGASIPVQADLGNVFTLTLTASTGTLANPTNPQDGQIIHVRVTQGSGGSFTLAYGTNYDFGAAGAPTLSTTAGKVDILGFEYVASLSKWCYIGSGLGF